MKEICFYGRFEQPVGRLAKEIAIYALNLGLHVQAYDSFAPFRPGAPTHSVVRVSDRPIRERSSGKSKPDFAILLDHHSFMFGSFAELKGNTILLTARAGSEDLKKKVTNHQIIILGSFAGNDPADTEVVINELHRIGAFCGIGNPLD